MEKIKWSSFLSLPPLVSYSNTKGTSKMLTERQAPVAHACNPSYSGGRQQDDHDLKSAPDKLFLRPYLKSPHHPKRTGGVVQV
jgi:hypothetical protein